VELASVRHLAGQLGSFATAGRLFSAAGGSGTDSATTGSSSASSPWKKRLPLRLAPVAIVAALLLIATGATFALLSATQTSGSNSFTAGTVTLQDTTGVTCTEPAGFAPGDSLNPCSLSVTYNGNLAAFMGLDVTIVTDPGSGGSPLYTANSGGLTFTLSDGTHSYTVPTTPLSSGDCLTLSGDPAATCYQALDELAEVTGSTPAGDAGNTTWNGANLDTTTFTLTPNFPGGVSNAYSGGSATVTMTAHAVQAGNNGSVGACTVGNTCSSPAWS